MHTSPSCRWKSVNIDSHSDVNRRERVERAYVVGKYIRDMHHYHHPGRMMDLTWDVMPVRRENVRYTYAKYRAPITRRWNMSGIRDNITKVGEDEWILPSRQTNSNKFSWPDMNLHFDAFTFARRSCIAFMIIKRNMRRSNTAWPSQDATRPAGWWYHRVKSLWWRMTRVWELTNRSEGTLSNTSIQ